ncbi:hypothetical protein MaudCBS49596_004719 [Microsporum audouinii]
MERGLQLIAEAELQEPGPVDVDVLDLSGAPQPEHLPVGQAVDCDGLVAGELAVLALQVPPQEDDARGGEELAGDGDAQREPVAGPVLVAVREGRPDAGRVAHGVDEGVGGRSFGRGTRDGAGRPAVQRPVERKDEDHEEEGEVARAEAVCGHEDDEADERDGDRVHEEPEAVVHAVGAPGVRQAVDDHEQVGRRDEQQRHDPGVAQRARQGREEVLEARGGGDGHVGDGDGVRLDVRHGQPEAPELAHAAGHVDVCLRRLDGQPLVGHGPEVGGQQPPRIREVGQHRHDGQPDGDGDGPLDDVQPSPGGQAAGAGQPVQDPRRDQAAERAADEGAGVEDAHAQRQLPPRVPFRQVEEHAREEGGLDEPEQEPAGHHLRVRLHERGERRHGPPGDGEAAQVERGAAHVVEQQVGRDLHQDVGDEEDGEAGLVLRANQPEILLQPLQSSSSVVVPIPLASHHSISSWHLIMASVSSWHHHLIDSPVDVVHEVDEDDRRHDEGVYLAPQRPLQRQLLLAEQPETPCGLFSLGVVHLASRRLLRQGGQPGVSRMVKEQIPVFQLIPVSPSTGRTGHGMYIFIYQGPLAVDLRPSPLAL